MNAQRRLAIALTLALGVPLTLGATAPVTAPPGSTVVTAQLLDYEKGYVFITSGDGFRVAPSAQVVYLSTGAPLTLSIAARLYARLTFDGFGTVTKIEVSKKALPQTADSAPIHQFAVALSTPAPNPDLSAKKPSGTCSVLPGRPVVVVFDVQVPPTTLQSDDVYMTTDQSGWDARAYKLTRVDSLHYRMQSRFLPGTALDYLFDRGSAQSLERGENGLDSKPLHFCVPDTDSYNVPHTVYHWGDERSNNGVPAGPQTFPTPFNPAPLPNYPPAPRPTPTH